MRYLSNMLQLIFERSRTSLRELGPLSKALIPPKGVIEAYPDWRQPPRGQTPIPVWFSMIERHGE